MRVQRHNLYRAPLSAVVRLARFLRIRTPQHACDTCHRALVERMARHEAFR